MQANMLAGYAQAMGPKWTLTRIKGSPGIHMYRIINGKNMRAVFDEIPKSQNVTFRHHSLRYLKKNTQSQLTSIELQYNCSNNKSVLKSFMKALNTSGFVDRIVIPMKLRSKCDDLIMLQNGRPSFIRTNPTYKGGLTQAQLQAELDKVVKAT